MASPPKIREGLTLEEFLRQPEIDEHPCLEYIDGRIEAKVAAQLRHCVLQMRLCERLNHFAEPTRLGMAFPELRCTFAGRSIVPDVVFLLEEHIELDDRGEYVGETRRPPDIQVEIISPDQSVPKARAKLRHATAHGCPLGWLFHPDKKWIEVYRPGQAHARLPDDGAIDGAPVLPGSRLPVAEVFGWLVHRRPNPGAGPA
jgi:Uma2 family endonuclease